MRLGRTLCALAFLCAVLALDAAPAAAHGVGGLQPTNVRSRVLAIAPVTPGLSVKVIENGRRLELTNDSGATVVVSGYENEPYLRVGPDGVFENTRSPAVFQNRSLNAPAKIPARYDASAAPEWHKVSDANHARWHDHRAHYMGTGAFKASQWSVPLTVDGRPVVVEGDLAWVAPGPWWPWLVLTLAIAGVIVLAAQHAWRLTVSLTLALLVWAELLHMVGSWSEVATTVAGQFGAQVLSFVAIGVGVFALTALRAATTNRARRSCSSPRSRSSSRGHRRRRVVVPLATALRARGTGRARAGGVRTRGRDRPRDRVGPPSRTPGAHDRRARTRTPVSLRSR